jgi:hypothetical protein
MVSSVGVKRGLQANALRLSCVCPWKTDFGFQTMLWLRPFTPNAGKRQERFSDFS